MRCTFVEHAVGLKTASYFNPWQQTREVETNVATSAGMTKTMKML